MSLYDAERTDGELLQGVVDVLSNLGGASNGRASVHELEGSTHAFAGPTDLDQYEIPLPGLENLSEMAGANRRLVSLEVKGLYEYDRHHCAIVTYVRIDPRDVGLDHHPIAIWSSGDDTCFKSRSSGLEVRKVFQSLVDSLHPSYGTITVEVSLCSPRKMASEPDAGWYYRNFYVAAEYVGERSLQRIATAASKLTIERSASGLFVFSSPDFGGSGRDQPEAGTAFAAAIASRV